MNILITAAQGETFQRHFPAPILEQLRALGTVVCNPFPRPFTAQELAEALKDTDIVITHWGTPQIDACMLDGAPRLRLLAHAAGTVAHIASEAFYEQDFEETESEKYSDFYDDVKQPKNYIKEDW